MPINFTHAFSGGPGFSLNSRKPGLWGRLLLPLIIYLEKQLEKRQREKITMQFQKNTEINKDAFLGPNSWCVNYGPPVNIQIGARTAVRGLLRCESFSHGKIVLGDNVYLGDDTLISCAERIEIESYTLIAHGVQIFDNDSHPVDPEVRVEDFATLMKGQARNSEDIAKAPIHIGKKVWIGINALLLKGVTVGDESVVAAGSVVTRDVPRKCLVAGNPARVIKTL